MRFAYVAYTTVALTLVIASFELGRSSERQARRSGSVPAEPSGTATAGERNQASQQEAIVTDHVLIENVACVSFNELWDVMRAASPERRAGWAHDLEQMSPGTRKTAAVATFYTIWAELDPNAAIHAVEAMTNKRLQSFAFSSVANAAAESALPSVAELGMRLGYRSDDLSISPVFWRWASADPESVAKFLEAYPNNSRFFSTVAYCWADEDPQKAGEWLINLKLPPLQIPGFPHVHDTRRQDAARNVLYGWVGKDSRGAANFATAHSDDPDVENALGGFGFLLLGKSRDEAAAFIQSLPTLKAQQAALTETFEHLGNDLILKEGGDEEEPQDPEIARGDIPPWLITLPTSLWIDHAGEIFESWDSADSRSAEAWLRSLPSDAQTNAITRYCSDASEQDVSRVLEVASFISNLNVRNGALRKFIERLGDNPSEVRDKIAALSLTNEQKRLLVRLVRDKK